MEIYIVKHIKFSFIVADTFLDLMLCPFYESMNDGACDEANNKFVCLFDGGDCQEIYNCKSLSCVDDEKHDPCPSYHLISNGQCNEENDNFICSFDGGDCQIVYVIMILNFLQYF